MDSITQSHTLYLQAKSHVILTVTDNITLCTAQEIIFLNYQQTNADASFTASTNSITCIGDLSNTFTANTIDTNLYNYTWEIDGIQQSGGENGILTTGASSATP